MPDSHLLENSPGLLRVLNGVVMMGVSGYGGVAFQVQGTFSGTITFESSVDGQEFVEMRVVEPDNSTAVTTTTAAGVFVGSVVGMTTVRARMSAYTNGSAAVTIRATLASPGASGGGGGTGSDVNVIEVGGDTITLGQKTMADSFPVVIASDQSPVPITGSISATNPSVSATGSPVPTDATYIGILDPDGNLRGLSAETFDYDTSGSTALQTALGLTIPSGTGPLPVLGGAGTSAQALRVELPTNGTGVIATVGAVTAVTTITNPVTVAQATAANLNATVIGAGSAGTANAGVMSIQGITSMTPVLVNQPTGTNLHTVIDSGTVTAVTSITNAVDVIGSVADDATTPGDPVMVGGMAKSPDGTSPGNVSAEDDVARAITDLNRIVYANTNDPTTQSINFLGSTKYTNEVIAATPGAGFRHVFTRVRFSSADAVLNGIVLRDSDNNILAGNYWSPAVIGSGFMFDCFIPAPADKGIRFSTVDDGNQCASFEWITKKV